jgi:hypothetical protein
MNPNTMTFKQVFHAEYQMSHFKQPVYQVLADTRFESGLTKGQTLNRSYASDVVANDMGGDGSYTVQAITDTQETLTINKEKDASVYIKELDLLQAHLPVKQKYAKKLVHALINQIDGDVLLSAYQGAGSVLDDGDLGGTAGNGITISANNVATVFTLAMQKLMKNNVVYNANARFSGGNVEVPEGMPMAVITPEVLTYIQLYLGGKDTMLGDRVSTNGFRGSFMGFELFVSNALPWTAQLELPTIPVAGDTVTINGVTFTAKASGAASNPGDFSIGANNDAAGTNLALAINGAGTPGASTYIEVSAANRKLLRNITASYNASTDRLTLVSSGWGVVEVSEGLTPSGDIFTVGKQNIHCVFGLSKSVSLVVQKDPSLIENPVSGKVGRDYVAWTVYGIKVFKDQQPQLVDVSVNAASFKAGATSVN